MIALLLAATTAGSAFFDDFSGVWRCGNANYHERWEIRAPFRTKQILPPGMTDVVYGDPTKPDGNAVVYYVPGANEYRYDDFHADGAQSHLTSSGPKDGAWTWTGTYYPANAPADPGPVITWKRTASNTISRTFAQMVAGKLIARGGDECVRESPSP